MNTKPASTPQTLAFSTFRIDNKSMEITFDPAKDAINQVKHGVSLADAARLDWNGMLVKLDARRNYGEDRYMGIATLGERLYSVIYTPRDEAIRVISLRRASQKEFDEYEHET